LRAQARADDEDGAAIAVTGESKHASLDHLAPWFGKNFIQ
jgi:hypothetical protein